MSDTPKPPDEFASWLDCAIFAAEAQTYEYGADEVHKQQMGKESK